MASSLYAIMDMSSLYATHSYIYSYANNIKNYLNFCGCQINTMDDFIKRTGDFRKLRSIILLWVDVIIRCYPGDVIIRCYT